MKIFVGCLLTIFIIFISIFVVGGKTAPIDVVRKYFELSRNQKIEEASQLWGNAPVNADDPVLTQKDNKENFRFDVSYSKEIFESKYEILDFREFPKSEDSTALCLSLQTKGQRKLIFRVELSYVGAAWKITSLKDAREDIFAVIHNDCNTVSF